MDQLEIIKTTITITIKKRNGEIYNVIFDLDDYENVIKPRVGKIHIDGYGYARGLDKNNKLKLIKIHRLIMEDKLTQANNEIDHKNNDTLDNRKSNLRLCTHQENLQNRKKFQNGRSIYKGVSWHKGCEKWTAQYYLNTKKYHIGCFDLEEDAGRAYDATIRNIFKEFAKFNFPLEHDQSAI